MTTAGENTSETSPWRGGVNGHLPTPRQVPEGGASAAETVAAGDQDKAEKARLKQQQRVTIAGYAGLVVVVAIAAAMSWHGLVGFAERQLDMTSPWSYGVPVSLDVAAMLCGFLALRSVISHDSAAGPRFLTLLLVAGSAWANYYSAAHMPGDGDHTPAALYFGAMSILSWFLWDVVLRQIRRSMLKTIGAVEKPLPKFRAVRWIRYPRETFAAWSVSVRFGLTRPEEALDRVWETYQAQEEEQEIKQLEELERLPEGISKRGAIELAFKALKEIDAPAAVEWCKERGVEVDRSYAYEVARKIEPPQLEAVV
ncbi:DUF2637 domain-containing protein [Streptomyces lavendulae]|uniref:DUF2637 domain-containing protein n=2 Tax=Streptomyces lavendulae TaxID=1914 RepID=UPI0036EC87BD